MRTHACSPQEAPDLRACVQSNGVAREMLLRLAVRRLRAMAHVGLTERLQESVLSMAADLGGWVGGWAGGWVGGCRVVQLLRRRAAPSPGPVLDGGPFAIHQRALREAQAPGQAACLLSHPRSTRPPAGRRWPPAQA